MINNSGESPYKLRKNANQNYCFIKKWFKDNCPRGKVPINPKTNPNPKLNRNPNRGAIFLMSNCTDT